MIYEWKVAGTCIIALNIYYLWPFGSFPGILDCWINVPGRYCTGTVGMEVASSARGFGRGKPTDPAGGPGAPTAAWPQGWLRARSAGPRRRDGHCCCAPRAYGVCCGQDGWRSLCRCCPPFYFWGSVVVSCWRWQFWGREITDRPDAHKHSCTRGFLFLFGCVCSFYFLMVDVFDMHRSQLFPS